ncbi:MAG: phosphatidylserine decarboxylase [Pseudomonas sp.]|uniref:phosphatidylserine decarboxylase n=1 Tax=Pseudomonas sp. TaxID=306 RepID=UPI0033918A10
MDKGSPATLYYHDRESGRREAEIIYGEAELNFLYGTFWGRALRRLFVTRPWFSRLNGLTKRLGSSRDAIPRFVSQYGIDAGEAEKSLAEYRSLDDFFSRRLKPGARPLDPNPKALLAPADGRVLVYPRLEGQALRVKQQRVSIAELLGCPRAAAEVEGGCAVVVRLAPKDYHRFHFPADGRVGASRAIAGQLESVHPIALAAGARSFANKRVVSQLETPLFGTLYLVDVGALTVGTIVQTHRPGPVARGQEKGYFRFGGSTLVLLWGPGGPALDPDLIDNSARHLETLVKVGTRIAALP